MGPAQPLADNKTAKVALDKEDKFLLEKFGNKGIRFMSSCEEAMVGMEAFLEKHTRAPVQQTPLQEAPVQKTPVQKTPVQKTPVQEAPVQKTSVLKTVLEAPLQKATVQVATVQKTTVQEAQKQKNAVQEAQKQKTAVQEAPVLKTPVQKTPVQKTPVQEAPKQKNPVQEAPVQKILVQEATVQKIPMQEAIVQKIPVQEAPVQNIKGHGDTMQKHPVQEAPVKEAPVKDAPVKEAPIKDAPMKDAPVKEAPMKEAPMKEAPVKDAPVKEAPMKEAPTKVEDVEADIIECMNKRPRLPEAADPDETEYSSSFGDTVSGTDNCSGLSEAEVESGFCDDNGLTNAFDAFNDIFHQRKKKVTRHWREFIRPLMWRCKWTELRMMEVESQALNYTRELAKYDQSKQSFVEEPMLEPFGSKSLPFTSQNTRKSAMKRRRRRKVEDTTDVGSYMLHHNLFSYLESKRIDVECFSAIDDFGCPVATDQNVQGDNEFGIHDDQFSLDSKNRQNSLEKLLLKIEVIQNRVHKLRTRDDDVMSKYGIKFSSSENLSLVTPFEAQTSCAPSPTFSVGNADAASDAPVYGCAQHIPELNIGDLVIPDAVLSSYEEDIDIPDIIESTMELLSSDDIFNQPRMGDSCEDIVGDVLIHDAVADISTQRFNGINDQIMDRHNLEPIVGKQESKTNVVTDLAPESVTVPREQATLESSLVSEFHVPKTKRKRGERKAGSGVWSRKCPGEPDSL